MRYEIKAAESGSCLLDDVYILHVISTNKPVDNIFTENEGGTSDVASIVDLDHDYVQTIMNLKKRLEYIGGYIASKVKNLHYNQN